MSASAHTGGISVVINTYNAARHLQRVIDSVKGFDEIVVCDMESTDSTVAIAEANGCKVVTFPKEGHSICEVARDFAIHSASCKWVLVVDADELVPPTLRDYLYGRIADPKFDDALCVGRRNPFMGEVVNNAPDYQLRFFQQAKAIWPPTIHSRPKIKSHVSNIPAHPQLMLEHLDNPTVAQRIAKMNTYTDYEVEKKKKRRFPVIVMLLRPFLFFLKVYLFGGAFRHGKRGVAAAYMAAMYQMALISKVTEHQIEEKERK